jgi:hypothetical protein
LGAEWRDPEDVCATTQIQGVLPGLPASVFGAREDSEAKFVAVAELLGERELVRIP